ncbi:MAG TPA: sugar phosphate nucleotidyltransferase, partial [Thermotogota bacterium]|nr:sugar phosphate nucleotidyltransferase [Thermotogota bacterium]
TVLQPYTYESGKAWFKGTADAIYENLDFLDEANPKYVLILSGDHIYGMDYMDMLNFHISKHAKASCACMNVPLNETFRFGIMVTDISKRIVEFQEKPQQAKSTLASLGIYIFNWDFLREVLIQDAKDESSSHDFGKDIIPKMVGEKDDIFAFEYDGYWRDVGTIYSYWESNLELIQSIPQLNLYNNSWRFYTRTEEMPPAYFGKESVCTNSLVSEGCEIHGVLNKSILFQGVQVGKGSLIQDSIILTGATIGDGVEISNAIIAENAQIGSGTKIGVGEYAENEENPGVYNSNISVIGYHAIIPENATISKNCVVHNGVKENATDNWQVPSGKCVR